MEVEEEGPDGAGRCGGPIGGDGMWTDIALLLVGLLLLTGGGELLVRGAVALAAAVGVSTLLIGLTVVSFGTSAPELAVSLMAAVKGTSDISVGNIVGSNLSNLFLILGVAALLKPIDVDEKVRRRDLPVMAGVTVLYYLVARDEIISFRDGLLLFGLLVAYWTWCAMAERGGSPDEELDEELEHLLEEERKGRHGVWWYLGMVLSGGALMVLGGRLLVDSASDIARALGVSEWIIGITIVAVGTSLPEMATSVIASLKGESDISIGNVVGSNVLNILCVQGLVAMVRPLKVQQEAVSRDFPLLVGLSVGAWLLFSRVRRMGRPLGAAFVGVYCLVLWFLVSSR